jgi:hypothetical protein
MAVPKLYPRGIVAGIDELRHPVANKSGLAGQPKPGDECAEMVQHDQNPP